jgi:hypothetical protein
MLTRAASGLSLLAVASACVALAVASACGNDYTAETVDAGALGDSAPPRDDAASSDAAGDAGPDAAPRCDPAKAFGAPVLVASLATPGLDVGARLVVGETLVFYTHADSTAVHAHIFLAQRATASGDFVATAQDPVLNTATSSSYNPSPTRDGLTVYFLSDRDTPGTLGLFVGTRASLLSTFTATKIPTVPADLAQTYLTPSGSALYYTTGGKVVRSPIVSGAVGAPVDVGLPTDAATPAVSPDELTLYYSAKNALDDWDIFMATRASTADAFGKFRPVDSVNTTAEDRPNWISEDGCELWLMSQITPDGGANLGDIYVATKPP